MEEKNSKPIIEVKKENSEKNNNFKTVQTSNNSAKSKSSFGKSVIIPFVSGVVGCAVFVGTCFGIPSIREKLIGNNNMSNVSTTNNSN